MSHRLPAGWSVRHPGLDDVATILALVHASDIVAVGEPDFTTEEIVEIFTSPGQNPARDSWLAHDECGRLTGWAYLDNPTRGERENLDVYVHPDGGAPAQAPLLDLALARIAVRANEFGYPTMTARAGVIASETHYVGVLRAAGFEFVKRYARMARTLDSSDRIPPMPPPGVRVRNVRPDDESDMRAFYELLRVAFTDLPDSLGGGYEQYRERVAALPSIAWDEWYVAEVDGHMAGILQSADLGVEQNEAWVKYLAVAKPYRGRGLGSLLLRTAFATYAAKGRAAAGLGVDLTNPTGAYDLYRRVGMHPAYEADVYERAVPAAEDPVDHDL